MLYNVETLEPHMKKDAQYQDKCPKATLRVNPNRIQGPYIKSTKLDRVITSYMKYVKLSETHFKIEVGISKNQTKNLIKTISKKKKQISQINKQERAKLIRNLTPAFQSFCVKNQKESSGTVTLPLRLPT